MKIRVPVMMIRGPAMTTPAPAMTIRVLVRVELQTEEKLISAESLHVQFVHAIQRPLSRYGVLRSTQLPKKLRRFCQLRNQVLDTGHNFYFSHSL
ncbi:hypothetical protein F2Q70_00027559 [Brassica cretica]|uniref:Uncharacterized protein n=1 Tax=Brassica cretica TaxID=69181 RepID=A0A8S9LAS0_BRACR|nr:hypothetical protein F2Q70_00027559 [Brassica cretica]